MSDEETCMDCGGPLEPCTCRPGCPGGQCADGCYLVTADAVRHARKWIAQNEAEKGGPIETLARGRDIRMWCRAVIAQHAEIERLMAALREALRQWEAYERVDAPIARIAELRKLVES